MSDPKILLGRLWVIFDAICFCLALYMTIKMIGRFREDRSATVISYRRYGDTLEHKYPDLVCASKMIICTDTTKVLFSRHTKSIQQNTRCC